jgi:acyl-coenzyme A synthetase/AMP-(fatty) acid ligase
MIQPFELLEKAFTNSPNSIGMVSESRAYTFSEMLNLSQALAAKFRAQGVRPNEVVSTFLPPDLDWLSTLGIFHEAAVPVSLWGVGAVKNLNVSWFVGSKFHDSVPRQQTIVLDGNSWQSYATDLPGHPRTLFARPDKPMRYVMTSGTTGAPKAVAFTGGNIQARLAQLGSYWADSRPELNFMGLSTTGGFFTALASLEHGYPYMAEVAVNRSAIERAKEYEIKVIAGSPAQIGQALRLIREDKLQLPSLLEVRIAGSLPTERLISAIHNDLGVPVRSVYGSTEGGGVAVTMLKPGSDTSDLGELIAGIDLQIEPDEAGSGHIKYRGPGVSSGYLDNSVDDESFAHGWFYPGDRGHISANGHLILEGRTDEIMNFGGTKIIPEKVEEMARNFEGVTDAAVCLIEQHPGIEEVAIAVVGNSSVDLRALDKLLRARLPIGHPTIFTTSKQIPRNRMGKIIRNELKIQVLNDLNLSS